MILAVVVVFVVGILMGFPLVLTLIGATVAPGLIDPDFAGNIQFVLRSIIGGGDSTSILAAPLFILSGIIMAKGGISEKIFNVFAYLLGHVPGGIPCAVIATCLFYGAISGSGTATCAAVGAMTIPVLLSLGYDKEFSGAVVATAAGLGVIIPPSVLFIIYGNITNVSPGKLLMAGIVPGFLGALFMCVICYVVARIRKYPKNQGFVLKNVFVSFKEAFWALMMPVIILGGIYTGIFTPTESGVVAAGYGLLCAVLIYREMSMELFIRIIKESCRTTGNVMILCMAAGALSYLLTIYQIPATLSSFLIANVSNRYTFMAGVVILLLFLGMFMDVGASILILGPLLAPVAAAFGIDPVQFGLIFVFSMAIGQATPPFGTDLFVVCGFSGRQVMAVGKHSLVFCTALIAVILLCMFIPQIATALPGIMA